MLLAFDKDLGPALRRTCDDDCDSEVICLAKAAKIVRRDMLEQHSEFTGSFDQDCQVTSLLALVGMIHNGPSIKSQNMSQATLSKHSYCSTIPLLVDELAVLAFAITRLEKLLFQFVLDLQSMQDHGSEI